MRTKLLSLASAVVMLAGVAAHADNAGSGYYVNLNGGAAKLTDAKNKDTSGNIKFKNSGAFGVGLGYKVADNFRTELAFNFRPTMKSKNSDTVNKVKVKSSAAMLNGYYDVGTFGVVKPYLGAGLGLARNSATVTASSNKYKYDTRNAVAFQLAAGSAFNLVENVDLDLSYRFTNLGGLSKKYKLNGVKYKGNSEGKFKTHEVVAGVRYSF